jgi:hypothetical protein
LGNQWEILWVSQLAILLVSQWVILLGFQLEIQWVNL